MTAALPGVSCVPSSFMNLSSTPASASAPAAAPLAAPIAMPNSGIRKIRPMRPPHSAPPAAPAPASDGWWSLILSSPRRSTIDQVLELDLVRGLGLPDVRDDLLGGVEIVVGDRDEMAHGAPLGCCRRIVRRARTGVVTPAG